MIDATGTIRILLTDLTAMRVSQGAPLPAAALACVSSAGGPNGVSTGNASSGYSMHIHANYRQTPAGASPGDEAPLARANRPYGGANRRESQADWRDCFRTARARVRTSASENSSLARFCASSQYGIA